MYKSNKDKVDITLLRYMTDVTQMSINKESYWITLMLLSLEGQSKSHDISMFCIEKYSSQKNLVSFRM